jgi:hypothetical protein
MSITNQSKVFKVQNNAIREDLQNGWL